MPTAARLEVRGKDKSRLRSWVRASGIRAGLAQRARIVLLAGEGLSNTEIAARRSVWWPCPSYVGYRRGIQETHECLECGRHPCRHHARKSVYGNNGFAGEDVPPELWILRQRAVMPISRVGVHLLLPYRALMRPPALICHILEVSIL